MSKIISVVSQKGGVGKSTIVRALAASATNPKLGTPIKTLVADGDLQQGTVLEWYRNRLNNGYPMIDSVQSIGTAKDVLRLSEGYDLTIVDGSARASEATLLFAKLSEDALVILPSASSIDDLRPQLTLANGLVKKGIKRSKILFVLTRVQTESEIRDSREFINESGFRCADGCLLERSSYRSAMNDGLSILETKYKSLNDKADEVIASIVDILMEEGE